MKKLLQRALVLVPVLLGGLALVVLKLTAAPPAVAVVREVPRALRVLTVEPLTVVPRASGYGTAEPGRVWRAVSRVEGRVEALHPKLRAGSRVSAGDELVRLEGRVYELAIARSEADLARTEAELAELEVRRANDQASLAIEKENLALVTRERERLATLLQGGTVSGSEAEKAERNLLAQRQVVLGLENALSLHPVQRRTLEAQLAATRASLEQARLDLEHCVWVAPFDGLVADVDLEVGQYVGRGEMAFELYGVDRVEIEVDILYGEARRLLGPTVTRLLSESAAASRDLAPEQVAGLFGATVRMRSGALTAEWEGELTGAREVVEAATQALKLRVQVEDPYGKAIPGQRPVLVKGIFCEVEFTGEPRPGSLVIPRAALREGQVWGLDAENRLHRRPVRVDFEQGDLVVLAEGLEPGTRVVVSDPGPAVEGALIEPLEDGELAARLVAAATGEERAR